MSVISGGVILSGGSFVAGSGGNTPLPWPGVPPDSPGALDGIVAVGGLVMNTASDDDVYENQGTLAAPTFARVDTLPA
jgi:hypothetical protein